MKCWLRPPRFSRAFNIHIIESTHSVEKQPKLNPQTKLANITLYTFPLSCCGSRASMGHTQTCVLRCVLRKLLQLTLLHMCALHTPGRHECSTLTLVKFFGFTLCHTHLGKAKAVQKLLPHIPGTDLRVLVLWGERVPVSPRLARPMRSGLLSSCEQASWTASDLISLNLPVKLRTVKLPAKRVTILGLLASEDVLKNIRGKTCKTLWSTKQNSW